MSSHNAMSALMEGLSVLAAMTLGCFLLALVTACKSRWERRHEVPAPEAQPRPFIPAQRGGEQR